LADKKKVLMLIRRSPLNSIKASEALRQSVGLTVADNDVAVILIDAAAWLSVPLSPETIGGGDIKKHLDTLPLLKARVMVEKQSLERYGIDPARVREEIEIIDRQDVVSEITEAQAVIPF
jgi:sulfur relay (sulfurtransferase) DsrF/TusC family protein